jgi:hypothetical protein
MAHNFIATSVVQRVAFRFITRKFVQTLSLNMFTHQFKIQTNYISTTCRRGEAMRGENG